VNQVEQAIKDAVTDLNERTPVLKTVDLAIVAQQANYTLPADYVRLEQLHPGVIYAGMVPDHPPITGERVVVQGGVLTIMPTPTSTYKRTLDYWAGHVLNVTTYQTLSASDVLAVLYKAQASVLLLQANKAAQQAWSYQVGEERTSKEKLAAELRAQANGMEQQYLNTLTARGVQTGSKSSGAGGAPPRVYGTRARYKIEG
jgi:hypothetical protein